MNGKKDKQAYRHYKRKNERNRQQEINNLEIITMKIKHAKDTKTNQQKSKKKYIKQAVSAIRIIHALW